MIFEPTCKSYTTILLRMYKRDTATEKKLNYYCITDDTRAHVDPVFQAKY